MCILPKKPQKTKNPKATESFNKIKEIALDPTSKPLAKHSHDEHTGVLKQWKQNLSGRSHQTLW
jgi:hypothetical protein